MEFWLKQLFWLSITTIFLTNVGYPIFLTLAGLFIKRGWRRDDAAEPTVSLIIAAYNEEATIAQKLENALALDYPRERLEIIVGSDGSTDRTDEIVRSFNNRGVLLRRFPRISKTGVQNEAVKTAKGEILVFSDANAFYQPDAIRKLVRNFADPEVACVSGQLVYKVDCADAGCCENCERRYWDYEKFMKQRESSLSSLVGANGSIYAVRRADYVEINNDLISDFVEPLMLVQRGKRVVYEPEAISVEAYSTTYTGEFQRKIRILTRAIHGVLYMRTLLNPFRYGIFSFQLFIHKLLRYLVPVFLVTGIASLGALAAIGCYRILFQVGVVTTLAVHLTQLPRTALLIRVFHLLYYYLLVNCALIFAWTNIYRGKRINFWAPARKRESTDFQEATTLESLESGDQHVR